ncbi:MAG: class I SAM-dependent methyltransferase [Candidatus Melainabacteria bacterium]|nr:class I SAM-dependent methyltransferase [Candidatus Melainabacteria bacterium]
MSAMKLLEGLKLIPGSKEGICRVSFDDHMVKLDLTWDRYIRLNAAARVINDLKDEKSTVLDIGGFEGALALFLPSTHVEVIDPVTTGGDFASVDIEDETFDIVSAIDVLEHIHPDQRDAFLLKLTRVARKIIILNYPSIQSKEAQEAVLAACDNQFVREHVEWPLPETGWVMGYLSALGFRCEAAEYGNIALWAGQFVASQLAGSNASELNRYLIENHSDEPFSKPLYRMVVCMRN